ncbi:hypothetical protein [Egicoccus sp. AB-alg2]|uniref:hypothetical protein n=1 Tax=Egicoccus sp. AB-alg2 TaxID=3242693 RepID=UPI00359DA174
MTHHDPLDDLVDPQDDPRVAAAFLAIERELGAPPDEVTAQRHRRAIRSALGATGHQAVRRSVAAGLTTAAVLAGLAAGGLLPAPAQEVVADAAAWVGFDLPRPSDDTAAPTPDDVVPAMDDEDVPDRSEPARDPQVDGATGRAEPARTSRPATVDEDAAAARRSRQPAPPAGKAGDRDTALTPPAARAPATRPPARSSEPPAAGSRPATPPPARGRAGDTPTAERPAAKDTPPGRADERTAGAPGDRPATDRPTRRPSPPPASADRASRSDEGAAGRRWLPEAPPQEDTSGAGRAANARPTEAPPPARPDGR